jgi:hypothetical protein
MRPFLQGYKEKIANKKAFTLIQAVVTLAIVAILITGASIAAGVVARQAYLTRVNDTAEVAYMALQSSLTDLKRQGTFDEVFSEDKRGENINHPQSGEFFYTVPDIVIDGGIIDGITLPKVEGLDAKELQELKESKDLVYLRLNKDDSVVPGSEAEVLYDLLEQYMADSGILNYSLIAEINLNNKTVRSVFYSERADYFTYDLEANTKKALLNQRNVLLRDVESLDEKMQGYYGSLGVGEREDLSHLDKANVKVLNDDTLTISWNEIGPLSSSADKTVTDKLREKLVDMTYDISIVNAVDMTKVYYKIKDVTAYDKGNDYVEAGKKQVYASGSTDPRSPMPVYDLYDYDQVSYMLDKDLLVAFDTEELQEDGSVKEYKKDGLPSDQFLHRFSYFVPKDVDGEKQYGEFRLVLDSITTEGDTELSIREKYKAIPWDEDFKVIVEAKYKGEGFTGSMDISSGEYNGYVQEKIIDPTGGSLLTSRSGKSGLSMFEEIFYALRSGSSIKDNIWYEVGYARHLNNLRYIVSDHAKEGDKKNFLLTDDIDWSLQRIGYDPGEDLNNSDDDTHRLTVSNINGDDLREINSEKSRVFLPLSTTYRDSGGTDVVGIDNTGEKGFAGFLQSNVKKDNKGKIIYKLDAAGNVITDGEGNKTPEFHNYKISNLKLANHDVDGNIQTEDHIGLFEQMSQSARVRNISFNGVALYGKNYVGALAGSFYGDAKNITVNQNVIPGYHKKLVVNQYGDKVEENISGKIVEPWKFISGSKFSGNTIIATEQYAGGLFGKFALGNKSSIPVKKTPGVIADIANGTRFADPNVVLNEESNGVTVKARDYAGGLIGYSEKDVKITKVVNAGNVEVTGRYAGGITPVLKENSILNGVDELAVKAEDQYVTRSYEKVVEHVVRNISNTALETNYGKITAGSYAAGVVGTAKGTSSNTVQINNVSNVGAIKATGDYAAGILGVSEDHVSIKFAVNKADIAAEKDTASGTITGKYAGGIAAESKGRTKMEGVQNLNGNRTVTAEYYAGGIVGFAKDETEILPLKLSRNIKDKAANDWILVQNSGKITAKGADDASTEDGAYAGGIAGVLDDNTLVNYEQGRVNEEKLVNEGAVRTESGSYAGGVAGRIISKDVRVYNAFNQGNVTAKVDYAGGIAGEISEHSNNQLLLNYTTEIIDEIIIPTDLSKEVTYTNTGTIIAENNYAGGIAGKTETDISNVFNTGNVHAQDNSGGIAGEIANADSITLSIDYTPSVAERLISRNNQSTRPIYTNNGEIKAVNNAGGIAGQAEEAFVQDIFNANLVTASNENAGGVIGNGVNVEVAHRTTTAVKMAGEGARTNIASVTAINNAGGVIGQVVNNNAGSALGVYDTLNSGTITVDKENAGGIVGKGTDLKIEHSTPVITAMLDGGVRTNTGVITAKLNNAGGIAGQIEEASVTDTLNGQTVTANNNNAGGLVGKGVELEITDRDATALKMMDVNASSNSHGINAGNNNAGGILGEGHKSDLMDVFNSGTVKSKVNAGGIAGELQEESSVEQRIATSTKMIQNGSYSNTGKVTAGVDNAGGIIGRAENKVSAIDTFNSGDITASRNNAGGLVGSAASEVTIKTSETVADEMIQQNSFSNANTVTSLNNSGGIVGRAEDIVLVRDTFNKGKITATGENAGGIAGYAVNDTKLEHSDAIAAKVITESAFSNQGNVKAKANAGGVAGKLQGNTTQILDVYSGDPATKDKSSTLEITATSHNAGGVAGRLIDSEVSYERTVREAIKQGIYTNNAKVLANYNAGGIIGNADGRNQADNRLNNNNVSTVTAGSGLQQNDFVIGDVYNIGEVKANRNNAGGIFGVGGDGLYTNSPAQVKLLIANNMSTNKGNINAGYYNAGGIFGFVNEKFETSGTAASNDNGLSTDGDVLDVFNHGEISARYNAGGIAGKAVKLDLKYTEQTLKDSVKADNKDAFVFTNNNQVTAMYENAGGIIGSAVNCILQDAFNSGTLEGFSYARDTDTAYRVRVTNGSNAGGLVGKASGLSVSYSRTISEKIRNDREYVYTNVANVSATSSNAGGILGYGDKNVQLLDVYNVGKVIAGKRAGSASSSGGNAGGIVGYLRQDDVTGDSNPRITDTGDYLSGIDISDNKTVIRDQTSGVDDILQGKAVSYITYTTITTDKSWTTNRYSNAPKMANIAAGDPENVTAMGNNAGGIVGALTSYVVDAVRVENVFNTGAKDATNISLGGIRTYFENAGGIIGSSQRGVLSYSFDINPGSDNLQVDNKGDHSTFAEAFNDSEVREDPYAIRSAGLFGEYVGLHMVANNAEVRASLTGRNENQSNTTVNFIDGEQYTTGKNAGGAVGYMYGGRVTRVYSLQGEVISPINVGGVVGFMTNDAIVKQASRLDGSDVDARTVLSLTNTYLKQRGSKNVGGIVGYASTRSQILDTRNFVKVTGRVNVGGIVGYAEKKTEITLAQNMMPITGYTLDAQTLFNLTGTLNYASPLVDKSYVDGSYIGGIVGWGDKEIVITMAKNDPLITDDFDELQSELVSGKQKFTRGGNDETTVTGKKYVGGITGSKGRVNYSINTGKIQGITLIGGISGSGYRITNSFNTGNVNAENGRLYMAANVSTPIQATHIGGIAGELGTRTGNQEQVLEAGTYIQNVYNSAELVRGASYVGGIAGYSLGVIDVSYNSADISGKQLGDGESVGEVGNKIGGLVGVLAQDKAEKITISNSYTSGQIVGTGDTGSLIGALDLLGQELRETVRVKNCYYLSDEDIRYWDSANSQINTQINYGLKPIPQVPEVQLSIFIEPTTQIKGDGEVYGAGDPEDELLADSGLGLRNYTNMIRQYSSVISGVTGIGNAPKGEENLQAPLNGSRTGSVTEVKTAPDSMASSAAKFKYPFDNTEMVIGVDYEFAQLDFSGDAANDQKQNSITLGDSFNAELAGNNQSFNSVDNSQVSNYYNYWPTKVIDYMKAEVEYNNGNNDDNSVYNDGIFASENTNKTGVSVDFDDTTMIPLSAKTDEELEFKLSFDVDTGNIVLPRIMNINVYDGHSRGYYDYKNEKFNVQVLPKSPLKTYTFIKQSEINSSELPTQSKEITIEGIDYYFYISGSAQKNSGITDEVFEAIEVPQNISESGGIITIPITIPDEEMDSYLAASTGYFTLEGEKVYDLDEGVEKAELSANERISRMFSMHFSNNEILEEHNDSVLDEIPDLDFDDFDTMEYPTDTAALSSSKLELVSGTAGTDDAVYDMAVKNNLQITNERHLYNLNKNNSMGYGGVGSTYLPYITKQVELKNNIQLTTSYGFNSFMIGTSKDRLYRMTGTLDGNDYTIGNIKVNRTTSGYLGPILAANEMPRDAYGLIYDLSGGVVKNLHIGNDSRIIADSTGALAYYVSNGRTSEEGVFVNNIFYENVGPQLPIEKGVDAKIYNTQVHAEINAREVGGFALKTARRFNDSADLADKEVRKSATFTDVVFDGKINAISNEPFMSTGKILANNSSHAAGILGYVEGIAKSDDIIDNPTQSYYKTMAEVNGSSVSKNGYVYAKSVSSGIIGLAKYPGLVEQTGLIQKSANNGVVASKEQANGISQGIISAANDTSQTEECKTKSKVAVRYSYNNGIVQTPEDSGLASGIGNYLSEASYTTNNGTVIGRIASGISSYGDKHTIVNQSSNNGYVQGSLIAGGIVAVSSEYKDNEAVPYQDVQVKLSNVYNSGTVVVTTNTDNQIAIKNSYAGGIIGYASSNKEIDWKNLNPNDIKEDDDKKTIIRNAYNVGTVYYLENGTFSTNNRNIGGIAGGGMNRFVDIQNAYNLVDSEAANGTVQDARQLNINFTSYSTTITDLTQNNIEIQKAEGAKGYNYYLTAVGDMPYGNNVTNMTYADMLHLQNFVGFNEDDTVWEISAEADVNGNVYPFPQFAVRESEAAYVGDNYIADIPDFLYNVLYNKERYSVDIDVPKNTIDLAEVTKKSVVGSTISYSQTEGAQTYEGKSVDVINDSHYSIQIDNYSASDHYEVTVYDGDAYATDYRPAVIRKYEIINGKVSSGGKLHGSKSVMTVPMAFFDDSNVEFVNGKLTIKNAEEAGWYMPVHGYYTVVVTKAGAKGIDEITVPNEGGSTSGILNSTVRTKVSDRFQVHFGGEEADGSNIQNHLFAYKYGKENNPLYVTDEYSVIGLTTSGIAQYSTKERYYKQAADVFIDHPFYSIFEFNGMYDGGRDAPSYPLKDTNYGIYYTNRENTDQDFGFISYLRTVDPEDTNFVAGVQNVSIEVHSDTGYAGQSGKYLEASNYVVNLGAVVDYMDSAKLEQVNVSGDIELSGYHNLTNELNRPGYINGSYTLAGIAGFVRNSEIANSKNDAALGVKLNEAVKVISTGIPGGEIVIPYNTHDLVGGKPVQIAGIAALTDNTKLNNIVNNGEMRASTSQNAAGLVNLMTKNSVISQGINGGYIRAQNGTAAGLVAVLQGSKIEQGYNSGKITGLAVQGVGSGTAVGIVGNISSGSVNQVYNAGIINGYNQAALAGSQGAKGSMSQAYYLRDENLYWSDPSSLPDLPSMVVQNEEDIETILGFAYNPSDVWGFVGDTESMYQDPLDASIIVDPYALSYEELSDITEMAAKGFTTGSNGWMVDTTSTNPTKPSSGNGLLRDYALDPYPFIQFEQYNHVNRKHINFPIFLGKAKEVGKTPFDSTTKTVEYVPFVDGVDSDETFKDTIKVDLNNASTTARYNVLVFDGNADLTKDSDENYIVTPKLKVVIERKYIDVRNLNSVNPMDISNENNKQYSKIYATSEGAYYYEIKAIDSAGKVRPAIFEDKDIIGNNKVNILFNNDELDKLQEPSNTAQPYYSATVIEFQAPDKNEETDLNNFYSKFSPHFAEAAAKQNEVWKYGSASDPYEIATQRNLYNIGLGGLDTSATDSIYLKSHYVQTQNITMTTSKAAVPVNNLAVHVDLWKRGIGTDNIGFSGSYSGLHGGGKYEINDKNPAIHDYSIFNRVTDTGKVEGVNYILHDHRTLNAPALLVAENSGKVSNIDVTASTTGYAFDKSNIFGLVVGKTVQTDSSVIPEVSNVNIMPGVGVRIDSKTYDHSIGSVIGKTEGSVKVENINTAASIINNNSETAGAPRHVVGGVIGLSVANAEGSTVTLKNIEQSGSITYKGYGTYVGPIGGVIGKTTDVSIDMEDVKSTGLINVNKQSVSGYNSNRVEVGGFIGVVENQASLNNYLNVKGSWDTSSGARASSSVSGGEIQVTLPGPDSNIGGIAGRVDNTEVQLEGIARTADLAANYVYSSATYGGVIGQLNNSSTNVKEVEFTGNIKRDNQTYGYDNSRGGIYGGIVGEAVDSDLIMNDVVAGVYDDISRTSVTDLNVGNAGAFIATNHSDVGGLVGKASTTAGEAANKLQITNGTNNSNINVVNASDASNVGGIIGSIENIDLQLTTVTSKGNITASGTGNTGGILGKSENSNVVITDAVSGTYDDGNHTAVSNIIVSSAEINPVHVGGLIGKAITKAGENPNTVEITNGTNSSNIVVMNASSTSNIGGNIGNIENIDLQLTTVASKGNITSSGTGSTGGILGSSENSDIVITDAVSGTYDDSNHAAVSNINVSNAGVNPAHVGGLIGKAITKAGETPNTVEITNGTNNSNIIVMNASAESNIGGNIGNVENIDLQLTTAASKGSITSNGTGNTGGLLGKSENSDIVMTDVVSGTYDDSNDAATSDISVSSAGVNPVYVGGLIGKAITKAGETPNTVEITNGTNNSDITVSQAADGSNIGGIAGIVDNTELNLTTTANKGNITSTNTEIVNVGGIAGFSKEADLTITDTVNTGELSIEGAKELTAGGILGRALAGNVKITDSDTSGTSNISNQGNIITKNALEATVYAAGAIGHAKESKVEIDGFRNSGDLTVNSTFIPDDSDRDEKSNVHMAGVLAYITGDNAENAPLKVVNSLNEGDITDNRRAEGVNESEVIHTIGTSIAAGIVGEVNEIAAGATVEYNHNTGAISAKDVAGIMHSVTYSAISGASLEINESELETFAMMVKGIIAEEAEASIIGTEEAVSEGSEYSESEETVSEGSGDTESEESAAEGGSESEESEEGESEEGGSESEESEEGESESEESEEGGSEEGESEQEESETEEPVADNIKNTSLKYNLNTGTLYATESKEDAFEVTATWELPVATDGTDDFNGEKVLDKQEAVIQYYNISLEDMIRSGQAEELNETESSESENTEGEELESEELESEESEEIVTPVTGKTVSLGEMKQYEAFQKATGWDETIISKALDNQDTPWIIETAIPEGEEEVENEYTLPRLKNNAYVSNDDVHYMDEAPVITGLTPITVDVEGVGEVEGRELTWEYKNELDLTKDSFAIIFESDGEILKVLEPDMSLITNNDTEYSMDLSPAYVADITNNMEEGSTLPIDVSVAVVHSENGRKMRGLPADRIEGQEGSIILGATRGMPLKEVKATHTLFNGYSNLSYTQAGQSVVEYAATRLGDPYSMPLAGQGSYLDCSYLVLMAYRSIGIELPRVASWQAQYAVDNGLTVSREELMPGDLVFWSFGYNGQFMNIDHVGIYAGDGMVIDASSSRGEVVYRPIFSEENQVLYARPYATPEFLAAQGETEMQVSASDLDILAAIIECEAGGESYEGKVAVGAVVLNRVASSAFPNSIAEVVYQSGQFTPVSSGIMADVLARGARSDCYDAARAALSGVDPVEGAIFFHAGTDSRAGYQIGNQFFYHVF